MQLKIITPEKLIVDREVLSVTLPGWEGELTALSGHDVELVRLKSGRIIYRAHHTTDSKELTQAYESEKVLPRSPSRRSTFLSVTSPKRN